MEIYSPKSLMVENKKDIEKLYTSEKELLEPFLYSKNDKNKSNLDYLLNSENLDDIVYLNFRAFVPKDTPPELPQIPIIKMHMGLLGGKEKKVKEKVYEQATINPNPIQNSVEEFLYETVKWRKIRETNEITFTSVEGDKYTMKIKGRRHARKFGLPYELISKRVSAKYQEGTILINEKMFIKQPGRIENVCPVIYVPTPVGSRIFS